MTRIAYLGNFSVAYSTESHVSASIESLGYEVLRLQEGKVKPVTAAKMARSFEADIFLWTQTHSLARRSPIRDRANMLATLERSGIPTVGFHLDRWWGLDRQKQVTEEPFFRVQHLFTADGGHDEQWQAAGINHHWLPPAVYHAEAVDGTHRGQYACDVVFVGSWRAYGHKEWWPTRHAMLQRLRDTYGKRFQTFPTNSPVRGMDLTDLYASCAIAVGDSCLAGNPARYWSDRVPETLGRGALLVHPYVKGIHSVHPGLPTFEPGNFDEMLVLVEHFLTNPEVREGLRAKLAEHTRTHHTYRNRMEEVCRVVLGDRVLHP